MTHRSPLVTLAGLVVAFGLMFSVNLASSAPRVAYGGGPASASSAPPLDAPSPSVSAADATESISNSISNSESASATPTPTATPSSSASESGRSEFSDRVVYAGRTRDGSAAIAVAVLGNRAAAYLCDGRSVEAWLRGTADEDEVALRSSRGSRLVAELHGDQLRGKIKVGGGAELTFRIDEAAKPAGLYRAKASSTTIGWIVLQDGSQVGVETTAGERSAAAPKLDPERPQVEVGGRTLEASPVEGDEEI